MNDTSRDPESDTLPEGGVQDDFSAKTDVVDEERRLHLRAFDYWHQLKGDKDYPLFSDLRAEDLAPYKANSLLLEFNQNGAVVRFLGEKVSVLVKAPITVGGYLKDFPDSTFAKALLDQFSEEQGRAKAAEFEFVEDHVDCRGIMLPFSNDGISPHFVMVISNFRQNEVVEEVESAALNDLVSAGQRAADGVAHNDRGNRISLYGALASALALYEEAVLSAAAYQALLDDAGLKAQKRAPFTPALKMVFGKTYDKTRLTEYAASLSFAVRNGVTSEGLVEFLTNTPGGIKGCVQQERSFKRGQSGTPEYNRHQEAMETLRQAQTVAAEMLTTNKEFCLILARQTEDGGVELLGEADVGQTALDAAIRNMALPPKK
ncbi:MAG: hypothetical protein AB3N28_15495 [Kordiimonas sp.]